MYKMSAMTEAIKNLETTTHVLDKFVNDPKNYNTVYSHYLEQMSWEMVRQANELKEIQNFYGEDY